MYTRNIQNWTKGRTAYAFIQNQRDARALRDQLLVYDMRRWALLGGGGEGTICARHTPDKLA